jgi:hypothetical protein
VTVAEESKSILAALRAARAENASWSVWVDTSVYVDFMTTISLYKNHARGGQDPAKTLGLMRAAAWMAMALDRQGVRTVTNGPEAFGKLDREVPPGTAEAYWTEVVINLVKDGVVPGWRVSADMNFEVKDPSVQGQERNDLYDDHMIAKTREFSALLVTCDKKAYKTAQRRRANVMRPDEYARTVIDLESARREFMRRLDGACFNWLLKNAGARYAAENVRGIQEAYARIWSS